MTNPPREYDKCTLCMACKNTCPCDALYVSCDKNGYERLNIDEDLCIDCGKCVSVCAARGEVKRHSPQAVYAAQAKSRSFLSKSASGGAFQMLARYVLQSGGICYGCAMKKNETGFFAKHIRIENEEELAPLLNSKYIPSDIGSCYKLVKKDLSYGKTVLFSGLPCQVEGLKSFLGGNSENLITADLICHGITGTGLFNSYIDSIEKTNNIEITDYEFRDKTVSWGTNYSYTFKNNLNGKIETRHCPREESSYMMHYLAGNIFRENCYSCTLATTDRVSDFTLGDYWEMEREHPEFVTSQPHMSLKGGISCILVNSKKGEEIVNKLNEGMHLKAVTLNSVTAHNSNLVQPSVKGSKRTEIMKEYLKGGWKNIDKEYREGVGGKMKMYRLKNRLKSFLPDRIRILVYKTPLLSKIIFHT